MEGLIPALQKVQSIGLVATLGLAYGAESIAPAFSFDRRARHYGRNFAIAALFILLQALLGAPLAGLTAVVQARHFGVLNWLGLPEPAKLVAGVLVADLTGYTMHVAKHKVPLLWRLHRMHHSDPAVDVSTTFRFHPGEAVFSWLVQLASFSLFGVPLVAVVFYAACLTILTQLQHANLKLPVPIDAPLQYLLVTPNYHKVHHSRVRPETDSNYGDGLAWWDRLFGTYTKKTIGPDHRYGLDGYDVDDRQSVAGMLRTPFFAK